MSFNALAQDETEATPDSSAVEETTEEIAEETTTETIVAEEEATEEVTAHQVIKIKFIEGGAGFMGIVILCLILGLAIAIEKIIYLNLADGNNKKLLEKKKLNARWDSIAVIEELNFAFNSENSLIPHDNTLWG